MRDRENGSCLLLELTQVEQLKSDLFEATGRPNLEIICATTRKVGWPKRECHWWIEVRSPNKVVGVEEPLLGRRGNGYNPSLLGPHNSVFLESRACTWKQEERKSMEVLVSVVNLWTEINFFDIWGTCKTLFKRKEVVGVENWVNPICLTSKLVPLPTRIWSGSWYSSAQTLRLAKLEVRWWVEPESRYQFESGVWFGLARSACIFGVDSTV